MHFMALKNNDRRRKAAVFLYLKNENLKSNTKRHCDRAHFLGKWEVSNTLLLWTHLNLKVIRNMYSTPVFLFGKMSFVVDKHKFFIYISNIHVNTDAVNGISLAKIFQRAVGW